MDAYQRDSDESALEDAERLLKALWADERNQTPEVSAAYARMVRLVESDGSNRSAPTRNRT